MLLSFYSDTNRLSLITLTAHQILLDIPLHSYTAAVSHTVRQYSELVGLAECALGADVQVDGGKTEVVPGVVWLRFGYIQVPCYLRHKPAAIVLFDEVGKFVD